MTPLRHIASTMTMVAPKGFEGHHATLEFAVIGPCCVSRWEPSATELVMLNAGGSVELWVMGGQPAVMLQAVPHVGEEVA